MPVYAIDLSDGTSFEVELDREATPEELQNVVAPELLRRARTRVTSRETHMTVQENDSLEGLPGIPPNLPGMLPSLESFGAPPVLPPATALQDRGQQELPLTLGPDFSVGGPGVSRTTPAPRDRRTVPWLPQGHPSDLLSQRGTPEPFPERAAQPKPPAPDGLPTAPGGFGLPTPEQARSYQQQGLPLPPEPAITPMVPTKLAETRLAQTPTPAPSLATPMPRDRRTVPWLPQGHPSDLLRQRGAPGAQGLGPGEKAATSLAAGTGATIANVGAALRWLGVEDTGVALQGLGEAQYQRFRIPHKPDQGWRSFLDPDYYLVNWAEQLPTSIALLPTALLGAYAGGATGTALGIGWFGRTLLQSLFGAAASRPIESVFEAGQTYDQELKKGATDEVASARASQVFKNNMALMGMDAAQMAIALFPGAKGRFFAKRFRQGGEVAEAAKRRLYAWTQRQASMPAVLRALRLLGVVSGEVSIEMVEEVIQYGIQESATGGTVPGWNPWNWNAETWDAARMGGLTGLLLGVGAKSLQVVMNETVDTLPPTLRATYATLVEQGQQAGLSPQQAQLQALDQLAATPEGKAHVVDTVQDLAETSPAEPAVPGTAPEAAPAPQPKRRQAKATPASLAVEGFQTLIEQIAAKYDLDPALLSALVETESKGDPRAVSNKGAMGLGQLMPRTATYLGVQDAFDPAQNLEGTAKYLRLLLNQFNGDVRLALAAYNAGPGNVRKYNGIPPFSETQSYIPLVEAAYQRYTGIQGPIPQFLQEGQPSAYQTAQEAEEAAYEAQLAQEEALYAQEQALLEAEAARQPEDLLAQEAPQEAVEAIAPLETQPLEGGVPPVTAPTLTPETPDSIPPSTDAAQQQALAFAATQGFLTAGQLQRELGLGFNHIVRLLDDLEAQGLLRRDPANANRFLLTDRGTAAGVPLTPEAVPATPSVAQPTQPATTILPTGETPPALPPPVSEPAIQYNDRVQFVRNGETVTGTVTALGDETEPATIRMDNPRTPGGVPVFESVQVPMSELTALQPSGTPPAPRPPAEGPSRPQGPITTGPRGPQAPPAAAPAGTPFVPEGVEAPTAPTTEAAAAPPGRARILEALSRHIETSDEPMLYRSLRVAAGFSANDSDLQAFARLLGQLRDEGVVTVTQNAAGERVVALVPQPSVAGSPAAPLTPEELTYPLFDAMFPRAGERVDGRLVRDFVPNTDSISATFDEGRYIELEGIREVGFEFFAGPRQRNLPTPASLTGLAAEIAASNEINPLIVAIDQTGPYILEGGHRFDALKTLGARAFPAVIVVEAGAQPGIHFADYGRSFIPLETPTAPEVPAPETPSAAAPVTAPGEPEVPEGEATAAPETPAAEAPPVTSATPSTATVETATPPAEPVSALPDSEFLRLAETLLNILRVGDQLPKDTQALQAIATTIYQGTRSEGAFSPRDLYDAMELAFNLRIQDLQLSPQIPLARAREVISNLERLLNQLPTHTIQTREQQEYQQYSTPPHYAYLVNWVANIQAGDIVLEPSAGNGGLAVFAQQAGAEVLANEILPTGQTTTRRLEALRRLGFDPTTHDALHLLSFWTQHNRQTPTVVVMNPPFSSAPRQGQISRGQGNRGGITAAQSRVGRTHVEEALKLLQPGGRLVAIVGEGMSFQASTHRTWWANIRKAYTIRANMLIGKPTYRKHGTTFGTRLLVIDKTGPQPANVFPVESGTKGGLPPILAVLELEGVRHGRTIVAPSRQPDRPALAPNGGAGAGDTTPLTTDQVGTASQQPGRPRSRGTGAAAGGGGSTQRPGTRAPDVRQPLGPGGSGGPGVPTQQPGVPGPAGGRDRPPATPGGPTVAPVGETPDTGLTPPVSGSAETPSTSLPAPEAVANPQAIDDISDSVFEPYTSTHLPLTQAQPHVWPLVETAAMAAVPPAKIAYTPNLPANVIAEGLLSAPQLEGVVYAGQAHEVMLDAPPEMIAEGIQKVRQGFFDGDNTGVGKGRIIAGIILDNLRRGRTKAIWITEKPKLFDDAKRDWRGIGQQDRDLFRLSGKYAPLARENGILFATYDTVKQSSTLDASKSRIQQIVDWVGKDFDGVLAFDEAHNMANNMATKSAQGTSRPAAKALAGIALQRALPNARVVYFSATGATEVSNLGYAERLGLWGAGTDFATKRNFVQEIAAGGVAIMELITRDLKALGLYVSRSLSYDGVTYERVEHTLTPQQLDTYNTLADAWQVVLQNIDEAIRVAGGAAADGTVSTKVRGNKVSLFWAENQRFFNQILTAMAVPSVIRQMEADLANTDDPQAIVIQLTNTNAAALGRKMAAMDETEELEDLSLTPLETLINYVENVFPVNKWTEVYDPNTGKVATIPLRDPDTKEIMKSPEAVAIRDALLAKISTLYTAVPESPMDAILNHFGTERVAEVTGRKQRRVRIINDQGRPETILQRRTDRQIEQEADDFMEDRKDILIFSEKGGTGRSYHADRALPNQRHRRHYVLQAGWRADKAMQGLGRTHRNNQKAAPTYLLVTTDIPGHKRFVSSIARRLSQLGALTRGQRQATTQGLFAERDNLESDLAQQALDMLIREIQLGAIPEINAEDFQQQSGLELFDEDGRPLGSFLIKMPQFLNRLLSLRVDLQHRVFTAFSERLDTATERAIQDETLDVGVETLRAAKIERIDEQRLATHEASGADTNLVTLKLFHRREVLAWDALQTQGARAQTRADGIGTIEGYGRNKRSGRVYAFLRALPRTEKSGNMIQQLARIGPGGRELLDREEFKAARYDLLTAADAAPLWAEQAATLPEFSEQTIYLVTGVILPHWSKLRGSAPRVYRVQTADGRRYLGRTITPRDLPKILANFGLDATGVAIAPSLTPTQALDAVLTKKARVTLSNGWRVHPAQVGREDRIEISGPNYYDGQQIVAFGAFFERIASRGRYFIPTDTQAAAVFERILHGRQIVDVTLPGDQQFDDAKDAMMQQAAQGDPRAQAVSDIMHRPIEELEASAIATVAPVNLDDLAVSVEQIVQRLNKLHETMATIPAERAFGVGKLGGRLLGRFEARGEVIRTKYAYDVPALAHEVAHHLLKFLFGDTRSLLRQTQQGPRLGGKEPIARLLRVHRAEIVALASPGPSPIREGFAEFVRLYLTAPQTAETYAPTFYPAFETFVEDAHPEVFSMLQGIQQDFTEWVKLPVLLRTRSLIAKEAGRRPLLPTRQQAIEAIHHLYFYVVHKAHPFARIVGEAERQRSGVSLSVGARKRGLLAGDKALWKHLMFGSKTDPKVRASENPVILYHLLRHSDGKGHAFIDEGIVDFATLKVIPNSPSLQNVVELLTQGGVDRTELWEAYMIQRRALQLLQRASLPNATPRSIALGKRAASLYMRAAGLTEPLLAASVAATEQTYPQFTQAHDLFQTWNTGLLTFLRDSGGITTEALQAILEMNTSYIPWHRVMDEGNWLQRSTGGGGATSANLPNTITTIKGSMRPFQPPLESAIRQAFHIVRMAERQALGRAVVDLATTLEGGARAWVGKVRTPTRPTHSSLREIQRTLEEAGVDVTDMALDEVFTLWRPDVWQLANNEVNIVRNGKREVWEIAHPDLYYAMTHLSRGTAPLFVRLLTSPIMAVTMATRFGVTVDPSYWLRNIFRDQGTFSLQVGRLPFVQFFRGLWVAAGGKPDEYQAWVLAGGMGSTFADLNYPALQRRRRELIDGKYPTSVAGVARVIVHPFQAIRLAYELAHTGLAIGENATRLVVNKERLDHPYRIDTTESDQARRAAYESSDKILNYGRVGAGLEAWRLITFGMGPFIAGADTMIRTLKEHPRRSAVAIATMLALTQLLRKYHEDDEPKYLNLGTGALESRRTVYNRVEQWRKDVSWVFVTGRHGETPNIWQLPKPWEWGFLSTMYERAVLDPLHTREGEGQVFSMERFTEAAERGISPNVIPDGIRKWLEVWYNAPTHTGAPLITRSLELVDPEFQYSASTSDTARRLGHALGVAPKKVDNLLRIGFLGNEGLRWSDAVTRLLSINVAGEKPQRSWAETPIFKVFMAKYPSFSSESMTEFHRLGRKIVGAKKTAAHLEKHLDPALIAKMQDQQTVHEFAMDELYRLANKRMSELYKAIHSMMQDPSLSGAEKAQGRDIMLLRMLSLAETFTEEYYRMEASSLPERVILGQQAAERIEEAFTQYGLRFRAQ